ncbi:hypothetical protein Syun_031667 [Stephania yunnanensis]|uniref:Uncharacterized protein n=1 Tax=Stephania yunnanensis TaxID=152371 RepID=A0AAP0E2T9_9MAGN
MPRTVFITLYILIASLVIHIHIAWHTISSRLHSQRQRWFHSLLVTPPYTITSKADVYPHDHGTRPSSSHYATPSPSAHPAHSPGVGDEHTSTSRRPPAPHRHSSARSSSNRLRSSIPHVIEEIPAFSDLRQPLWKAKTLLFISLLSAELTRRLEEMSTQTPDTSIDEDAAYLEVVPRSRDGYTD